jgi:hypothetical protein
MKYLQEVHDNQESLDKILCNRLSNKFCQSYAANMNFEMTYKKAKKVFSSRHLWRIGELLRELPIS